MQSAHGRKGKNIIAAGWHGENIVNITMGILLGKSKRRGDYFYISYKNMLNI